MLPGLIRETFSKRGLFYKVEKAIVNTHSAEFQMGSGRKAVSVLTKANSEILDRLRPFGSLSALVDSPSTAATTLSFLIHQFECMAKAHLLVIQTQKNSEFSFLKKLIIAERNMKTMIKKIADNELFTDSMRQLCLEKELFSEAELQKAPFITNLFLLHLLDAVWRRHFVTPLFGKTKEALGAEIVSVHTSTNWEKQLDKKHYALTKVLKWCKQQEMDSLKGYDQFLDRDDDMEVETEDGESLLNKAMISFMEKTLSITNGVSDFLQICDRYERVGFFDSQSKTNYFQLKRAYLWRALYADLSSRIATCGPAPIELSLHQIVP